MRNAEYSVLIALLVVLHYAINGAGLFTFLHIFYSQPKHRYLTMMFFILNCILIEVIHGYFPSPVVLLTVNYIFDYLLALSFNSGIKTRIICITYYVLINVLIETLVYIILTLCHVTLHNKVEYTLACFICGLIAYLVILILRNFKIMQMKTELPVQFCFLISSIPFLSIGISLGMIIYGKYGYVFTLVITLIIFAINLIVFYLYYGLLDQFNKNINLEITKQQNICYEQQLKIMLEAQSRIRIFRHDSRNLILVIQSMLEQGKVEQAKSYLNGLGYMLRTADEVAASGNIDIDALINHKYNCGKDHGITMRVDLNIPENLNVDAMDIAAVLGNLLDNAMEAVMNVKGNRWIEVNLNYDRGILFIHIENPFEGELNRKKKRLMTTKKDDKNHGIGMISVKKIVAKYKGIMEFHQENQKFIADVILYL